MKDKQRTVLLYEPLNSDNRGTSRMSWMSYLWICFNVLHAAVVLQSSVLGKVSLKCNDKVEVIAEDNVMLNCSIIFSEKQCIVEQYYWRTLENALICKNGLMDDVQYTCGSDNLTYVYLTISNVSEDQNYTIIVQTDCGISETSIIKVLKLNKEGQLLHEV
ncbi:hypothetical protein PAMP_010687 [Pampus punctatissimus]